MYQPRPLTLLRVALALVMGYGALRLVLDSHRGAWHGGVHPMIATTLGVVELLGAVLFLIPPTLRFGAWLLAASLVGATLLHLHGGQAPSPVFLVYAAGVWAVASEARGPKGAPT
jgi:hypothetical protein